MVLAVCFYVCQFSSIETQFASDQGAYRVTVTCEEVDQQAVAG